MTISLVVGLPGSGKSYTAVERLVVPALKAGRLVVTNLPLRMDAVEKLIPGASALVDNVPNDEWLSGAAVERIKPGALVLVDEAWRVWPATGKPLSPQWGTIIAEHRHMVDTTGRPVELVLITQSPGQISTGVRRLIERSYHAKKLGALGARGSFSLTVRDGIDGPEVSSAIKRYVPEVYALYQSHTRAEEGKAGAIDETPTDRVSLWRSGKFRLFAFAFVVGGYWCVSSIVQFFNPNESELLRKDGATERREVRAAPARRPVEAPPVVAAEASPARPAGLPLSVQPLSAPERPGWCSGVQSGARVAGTLSMGEREVYLIASASGLGYVARDKCLGEWPVVCCHLDGGRYVDSETYATR